MVVVIQTRDCSVCGWLYSWGDNILTPEFGFGMFAYNMICLMIGLLIIYFVIRNIK